MKITITALIILLFGTASVFAQNTYSIKGGVADTASNSKLTNATVAVLNAKDSILQKFTRVNDGQFAITNLKKGKFILLVSYSGYADFVERFTLDSAHTTHDFGRIGMILKTQLLKEVIIKAQVAAVKIKGDTTEFNAKAFTVQPNAKVEDLLKELPGIQVDKDGKITAQGQTVSKVLVDGEEFFGDDPTLVTKNLRADMVDKVQLYDKKSDQAAFTGIDDGVKNKTINIKLKEDKKNGYFGKIDADGGTDKYYQEQILFNRFKGKQKFSVYGTLGNTGKVGLGWDDNSKYGGSGGLEFGDGGEIYFNGGGGDDLDSFSGRFDGEGIPLARSAGAHYDTKWNGDKESINGNYKIGSLNVDGTKNTIAQNNFDGTFNTNSSDQTFHNHMFRQKLDLTYQVKIDTSQNLKLMVDGTSKDAITNTKYDYVSNYANGGLQNTSKRNVDNDVKSKIFNASAFYTKKFKKVGRTFSLNVSESLNQSESKGQLYARTKSYDTTATLTQDTIIDQRKVSNIKSNVLNTNLTYTEPLTKKLSAVVNYGINLSNNSSDRRSYNDPGGTGSYTTLDTTVSNFYKLNQVANQFGLNLNYKGKKATFNFGSRVSVVNFKQIDEIRNTPDRTRNFVNWFPQATFQYRFSQQESVRLSYNGNTTQPTIDQIQPVLVNNDPVNRTIGNPNLRPSYTNRLNFSYNSYKVLSGQSIWLYGSYSNTYNPIVSNVTTVNGRNTYVYTNLNSNQTVNMYASAYFDRKIPKVDVNAGLGINGSGNTYYNFVKYNDGPNALNKTQSYTYSLDFRLSKYKQKKYDMWGSVGPTYTVNSSSLQTNINNNGRGLQANGGFNIYLPLHFSINSDATYQYNAATQSFPQDFRKTILNVTIGKTFTKDESFKIYFAGNDLLNQNTGYSRTGNANQISQERYTTIRRFFMLSLVWDFNHVGGGAAPAAKK
ncbi:outer membrane beta-barrel protein [Mucilaginibacter ginsenosidivorax]|uniref:Outer membrane beta-barrel protein n=2 Tax=Mucilaginibacter ginsenosidivorax TaxID=862126 RepID=A0A5B8VY15_9SPHI|nr:outer membrane beta-barrel protein [Mucilaginibacter ginsenosidivorax]QEC76233.1 outer membrane beta-barrel protein [Mucilaginibacter ginsenosidivorax]